MPSEKCFTAFLSNLGKSISSNISSIPLFLIPNESLKSFKFS